jgi:hypothetical protein
LAFGYIATLYLSAVSTMHSYANSIYVVYFSSQDILLCIVTLTINPTNPALGNFTVLNDDLATAVGHRENGSSLEVGESAGTHDDVRLHEEATGSEVVVIAHEFTVDDVHSGVREGDQAGHFGVQVLREGSQGDQTVTQD